MIVLNDMDNLTAQLQKEFNADTTLIVTQADEFKGVKTIQLFNQEKVASSAVGMDYRSVTQELVKPIQRAIMKAGSSSIARDLLGTFLNAFPIDPGWGIEELFETGKLFYVLKNQSREAHIYNLVRKACEEAEGDIITMPAVSPMTIAIDEPGLKLELKTHALTFTRKELKYMKFAFIKQIDFQYNDESNDPYLDACYVITIDRAKLEVAPFVSDNG